ncbi:MAG: EAL domain-containing protein [Sideroxydans sp.]
MMIAKLLNLLCLNQSFAEHEQHFKYKVIYLTSILSLVALIAFGMGFYRWQFSPLMGAIDFVFVAMAVGILVGLKRNRQRIETWSTLALLLSFALCYSIYLLAPYQSNRLSIFFLLAAAALFLQGVRRGMLWVAFILIGLLVAHYVPLLDSGYSHFDVVTGALYLLTLLFMFAEFERLLREHRVAEEENEVQRRLDARWKMALESAGDAIWDWDIQADSASYSKGYTEMLGYAEDELGHKPSDVRNLLHPLDAAQASAYFQAYVAGGCVGQYSTEQRFLCKDGSYKWVLCRGSVVERSADGKALRMLGTHVDLSNYKKVESNLLESEKRLSMALDSAQMGVWEYDVATQQMYWSREVYHWLGLDYFSPSRDAINTLIHPEDLARIRALKEQASLDHLPFLVEFRYGAPEKYRWAEERGEVKFDAQGRPVRVIGTVQDITERKRVESAFERARVALEEQRSLLQSVLDNAPLGIWMTDAQGKAKFANHNLCQATGISEAQFLNAPHYTDVLPMDIATRCKVADAACLAQKDPYQSQERIKFTDGREHLVEVTKVKLTYSDVYKNCIIGIAADVTERQEYENQLEHIAHFDALTSVPNRVLLADRLVQAMARTKRDKGMMAVCYLDLDGFKPVNDNYGHAVGDRVLVEVARRIKNAIREDDTVARLGGDEFVVLLVGMLAPEECVGSLHRLLELIHEPIEIESHMVILSASIGVAIFPEGEQDADTLMRHADQAMYAAKQSGKNRYHLYDASHDLRARSHHELVQQIRTALALGEFELYYQPKVNLRTREMVGVEALIRWNHAERGVLLPGAFLRSIENTELEIELGEWVIRSALEQIKAWRKMGRDVKVSINISAYQLQAKHFVAKLKAQVDYYYKDGCVNCLQIEVLETAALEDIEVVGAIIHACREFGVSFALDDFGTGYSSLKYLSYFDLDTLKIDQSFVHDMMIEKGDHAIVQAIIALTRSFGREVVAEGVENEAQFQALLKMGCEVGQGFGIARPMPAIDLIGWRAS